MKKTIAFHTTTKVLPGQKIEIHDADLPPGETVEVFVVISKKDSKQSPSLLEFIDRLPGQQHFKTAAEVDRYLQEERDSWEN